MYVEILAKFPTSSLPQYLLKIFSVFIFAVHRLRDGKFVSVSVNLHA